MNETMTQYDTRHGGAYDRGSADAYYGRSYDPHLFRGDTYSSERVELADMTADEITAYTAGYRDQFDGKVKIDRSFATRFRQAVV
jgi:hypothetical protein